MENSPSGLCHAAGAEVVGEELRPPQILGYHEVCHDAVSVGEFHVPSAGKPTVPLVEMRQKKLPGLFPIPDKPGPCQRKARQLISARKSAREVAGGQKHGGHRRRGLRSVLFDSWFERGTRIVGIRGRTYRRDHMGLWTHTKPKYTYPGTDKRPFRHRERGPQHGSQAVQNH